MGGVVSLETLVDAGVLTSQERELLGARTAAVREVARGCTGDERALLLVVETPSTVTTGRNAADFCGPRPGIVPVSGLAPLFDVLRRLGQDAG